MNPLYSAGPLPEILRWSRRDLCAKAPHGIAGAARLMPHDLFILGCGRSGTSLLAGLFGSAGYFQGTKFYQPRPSNPRGFFEDAEVNDINETILRPLLSEEPLSGRAHSPNAPGPGQGWLARIPAAVEIPSSREVEDRIGAVVANRPFCLKDPRFCYTLHLWRAQAPAARMICVFRQPRVVVASILTEIAAMPYLRGFALGVEEAFEIWLLMYRRILERHAVTGDWLFVDYADVFELPVLERISRFCGAPVDIEFPDRALNRSTALPSVDRAAEELYAELVARSKATLDSIGPRNA